MTGPETDLPPATRARYWVIVFAITLAVIQVTVHGVNRIIREELAFAAE
jgi:hypothetical protein